VAVDITQHEKIQAELENYRDELLKTRHLAEIGTMGATMAEQLHEPLSITQLLLQRMSTDLAGQVEGEVLNSSVQKGLSEISKGISVLEKFHKTAQLEGTIEAEPVDIYLIVRRMMAVFADSAKHANLQLVGKGVDIVPHLVIPVRELEQLFFIVIQNAIDAADISKAEKLTISCEIKENQVGLVFADNCCGIAPEKLQHIFKPFSDGDFDGGGTGMGLAIAQQIVLNYKGSINVESEVSKGTTLSITLPVEQTP
jgi:two-component system C4-dicarboxylate transport sensor histidine kinase DctB